VALAQCVPDEIVEVELLRPRDLDDAVRWALSIAGPGRRLPRDAATMRTPAWPLPDDY
jgi:hypothetical protein